MSNEDRYKFARWLPKGGIGVEVGVAYGEHAAILLEIVRPERLYLVDPWEKNSDETNRGTTVLKSQAQIDEMCQQVRDRFKGDERVKIIRASSDEASTMFGVVEQYCDWAYIDGQHTYEMVKKDIANWLPWIRAGGVICGHDWTVDCVKKAVEQSCEGMKKGLITNTSWAYKKVFDDSTLSSTLEQPVGA